MISAANIAIFDKTERKNHYYSDKTERNIKRINDKTERYVYFYECSTASRFLKTNRREVVYITTKLLLRGYVRNNRHNRILHLF